MAVPRLTPPSSADQSIESELRRFSVQNAITLGLGAISVLWFGRFWVLGLALAVSFGSLIYRARGVFISSGGFGAANIVTALRCFGVAALCWLPGGTASSSVGAIVLLVFALDGLDGWLARRFGASRFGAHFDMESDAALVLWAALWLHLRAGLGWWVLGPGLLRYVYVLVLSRFPSTASEEPRSLFGRLAFSGVVLGFVAALVLQNTLGEVLAALGSLWVGVSFARSFWWSYRSPSLPT